MSASTFYAAVAVIAVSTGSRFLEVGRTSFSRLSGEAQEAIVDAMLAPDGKRISVSAEVHAEIQACVDAEE